MALGLVRFHHVTSCKSCLNSGVPLLAGSKRRDGLVAPEHLCGHVVALAQELNFGSGTSSSPGLMDDFGIGARRQSILTI